MRKSCFILAALLPLVLGAANLLPNGGFEDDTGWKPWGLTKGVDKKAVFFYDTEVKHSGARSIRIVDTWDFARSYPICVIPAVRDAKEYRLTFWARAEKEQVFRAGIALPVVKDGKRRNALWTEKEFTAGPEWKEFAMSVPVKSEITEVLVLFGATGMDKTLTGTVWIDDAELTALAKDPTTPRPAKTRPVAARPAGKVEIFSASPEVDPARAEKTDRGFRLKPGVKSNVGTAAAAPDVRFTKVQVPKDGYYRFFLRVEGPRSDAFCRLGIPGFPPTRTMMMRRSMHSGDWREIGVYPMKKGEQTVSVVLPETLMLTDLYCVFDGPRPLPKEFAEYDPPVKPQGRPRLLVDRESLKRIRANLGHPEMRRALALVRKDANNGAKLQIKPGEEVVFQRELQKKLIANAFFALVNDDKKLSRQTAETLHRYITQVTGFPGINYFYDIRDAITCAAYVYDWCYDELTPQERRDIVAAFYRLAIRLEVSWPPLRQSIVIGHGNGGQITIAPLAFAIACFDEDPEPFRIIARRVLTELVPMKAYEYRSPLHPQGSNYGSGRLRSDLYCATAFRMACGKEVFDTNLFLTPIYWRMLRLPDSFYFEEGDIWGFVRPPQNLEMALLFCTAATRDPAVKGFYLAVNGDRVFPLYHLLFNDPELKPVKPADAVLPNSYYFGPFHGSLLARTGWWNDEAAVYCIGGLKFNTNHEHFDVGSFQIWYRGLLTADIGEYQSSYGNAYDMNFDKRSIAHNMLRVYDPEERFGRFDNDGGTRFVLKGAQTPEDYEKNPLYDYGTNRAVSIGPDKMRPVYSVMATDLTNAYSKKIKHYMRLFVFLNQNEKDRPATFLVCDLAETSKAEFKKIYQVSTYRPPVLKPNFIGLSNENGGRADVNIYLPKQVKITDYANEKAASNPFVGKQYELPVPGTEGHHAHRIEVTPAEARTFDTFLAHYGIRAENAKPFAEGYAELANAHLVRSGKFLVTLPKKDELISTPITLDIPTGGAQVLCVYLAPGKWHAAGYNFTVKAGENTLFLAAPAGSLEIAPGELAGKPEYAVPAEFTPPASKSAGTAIFRDGKPLPGKVVWVPGGTAMVPVANFPDAPKFTEGKKEVEVNGEMIRLNHAPRKIGGVLYVPVRALAGALHARVELDRFLERAALTTLPDGVPGVVAVVCPKDPELLWSRIDAPTQPRMEHGSYWAGHGQKETTFTFAFDRPVTLGALAVTYTYGATRDFPVKLEASMDGKTFHTVFDGMSEHGKKCTIYRWKPEKMRYLRYLGNGCGTSGWTAIDRVDFPEK